MNNVVPNKLQISSNRKVKNLQTMSLSEKVLVTTSVFSPPGVNFMNINININFFTPYSFILFYSQQICSVNQ